MGLQHVAASLPCTAAKIALPPFRGVSSWISNEGEIPLGFPAENFDHPPPPRRRGRRRRHRPRHRHRHRRHHHHHHP